MAAKDGNIPASGMSRGCHGVVSFSNPVLQYETRRGEERERYTDKRLAKITISSLCA